MKAIICGTGGRAPPGQMIAFIEISLAVRSSLTSRSSSLIRAFSSLLGPLRSRDLNGDALRHFGSTPVALSGAWRLGELVFRILFNGEGKRQPQVTVKIRPPGVVQFRRTLHEARVMTLIERNGLMNDRDNFEVVDAAE